MTFKLRASRDRVDDLARLVAIAGAVTIALAVFGPRIGLGVAEQSVFYVWLGLTRTDLGTLGATAITLAIFAALLARVWRVGMVALANMGIAVLSIMIGLVILEVIARVMDGMPVFAMRNWLAERNALLTTQTLSEYDPLLGWMIRSNLSFHAEDPTTSFTTGRYGIRLNRPGAGPSPAGGILAVGDSFTAGSDVGDRHAWPAQLEALIQRPVINGAAGGWAADQIVLRAESLLPILEPATVIVSFYQDDIARAHFRVYGGANKPFFTIENGELVRHNRPVPLYTGRPEETPRWLILPSYSYLVLFTMDRLGWSNWWQVYGTSYMKADNDPVEVTCQLLRRLERELGGRGTRLLLVMQYGAGEVVERPEPATAVVACAQRAGIDTLDLWDDLVTEYRRSFQDYARLWTGYDGQKIFGHMSSLGNWFVAERIAARLTSYSYSRSSQ
jgi:hypothetical protein